LCMHGSQEKAAEVARAGANVHALEATSRRSALHKAAFWGHTALLAYLTTTLRIDPNTQDTDGDTALHDAAKVGGWRGTLLATLIYPTHCIIVVWACGRGRGAAQGPHGPEPAQPRRAHGA
jgi:hypothetical protein